MSVSSPVVRSILDAGAVGELQKWASEVEAWPVGSHVWGHYAEQTARGEVICRTENVSACHAGFRELVDGPLCELASSVLGTAATAFKDKVNYKRPGGAGFSPHQDLLAYPGAEQVVSILVAVDRCSEESGCLWIARGVDELLDTDERGVVSAEAAKSISWQAVELEPGDALCIGGLLPHYSEANRSPESRRVLVASYSPSFEGYGRDSYYEARSAEMEQAQARDGAFRISTLADFEGIEVPEAARVVFDRCTHP